eukprot:SAG11_NODE_3774_length_2235_cov_5.958801_1_plen_68_part_10
MFTDAYSSTTDWTNCDTALNLDCVYSCVYEPGLGLRARSQVGKIAVAIATANRSTGSLQYLESTSTVP